MLATNTFLAPSLKKGGREGSMGSMSTRVGWARGTKPNSRKVCWVMLTLYPTYMSTLRALPNTIWDLK